MNWEGREGTLPSSKSIYQYLAINQSHLEAFEIIIYVKHKKMVTNYAKYIQITDPIPKQIAKQFIFAIALIRYLLHL